MSRDDGRALHLGLWLLLAWSFGLRIWIAGTEAPAWDERFSVRNAVWALSSGELRPENGFHPTLSWLPQLTLPALAEGIHQIGGGERWAVVTRNEGTRIHRRGPADGLNFTRFGLFLARLSNAAFGLLSIALTFVVGRRLFGGPAGLLAAALVAGSPWHLRQSAIWKPDIVLVALAAGALLLALRAAGRGRLGDWLAAGAAVGAAASAKFNGVAVGAPLAVAAVAALARRPRRWLRPAAAGLAAAVCFLALNPFLVADWPLFEADFGQTVADYEARGQRTGASHLEILAGAVPWLLRAPFHGPVAGTAAVAGLLLLAAGLARPALAPAARRDRLVFLAFPLGYAVVYAAATDSPLGWHNWLVLLPATAIAAGWLGVEVWRRASRLVPALGRIAVAALAAVSFVATLPAAAAAYRLAVPTTWQVAANALRRALPETGVRWIVQEGGGPALRVHDRTRRAAVVVAIERLEDVPRRRLELADAEVLLAEPPPAADATARRRRLERAPAGGVLGVAPRWLEARGPALVLLVHPWQLAGRDADFELRRRGRAPVFTGRLARGHRSPVTLSMRLWPPPGSGGIRLEAAGRERRLLEGAGGRPGGPLLSERFVVAPRAPHGVRLELEAAPPELRELTIEVLLWRPPRGGSPAPPSPSEIAPDRSTAAREQPSTGPREDG